MAKTENDLIFEGNIGSPYSERNLYFLDENSRGYYEGIPDKVFNLESDLFSTHGNGALFNISDHKTFMKLSYYETIEIYDFKEDKYTIAKLEDKLGYKVESSKNSLLETNEENTFIYAYVTVGNHLIMTKFKIVSNDANNCMEIIKTSLEDFITVPTSSRRCIITPYQYIECLDIDENKNYVVRIYDSDLNFLKQYELDTINIPTERMYAANWIYQFSILTICIQIFYAPYNAAIISCERMSIYAYISIFDVLARLGVVYILIRSTNCDKLILYGALLCVVSLLVGFIYICYCLKNFTFCRYK